jgi:hypothetical protein
MRMGDGDVWWTGRRTLQPASSLNILTQQQHNPLSLALAHHTHSLAQAGKSGSRPGIIGDPSLSLPRPRQLGEGRTGDESPETGIPNLCLHLCPESVGRAAAASIFCSSTPWVLQEPCARVRTTIPRPTLARYPARTKGGVLGGYMRMGVPDGGRDDVHCNLPPHSTSSPNIITPPSLPPHPAPPLPPPSRRPLLPRACR